MKFFFAAICAVLLPNCAPAFCEPVNIKYSTSGYVYFNRAGADLKIHDTDLDACAAEIMDELHPKPVNYSAGALSPLVTGLVYDAVFAGANASRAAADIENCMIAKGWRVVRVPEDEGAQLVNLSQADLIVRMTPWIGAITPHGDIVRVWNNDLVRASSAGPKTAAFFPKGLLSWKLHANPMTSPPEVVEFSSLAQAVKPGKIDKKWPVRQLQSLNLSDISKAPPGSALLVVRVIGLDVWKGRSMFITRLGPNGEEMPSIQDHAPDMFGFMDYHYKTDWILEVLPPGRWRIATLGLGVTCLGAPIFEVKAGDVIYAGTFDMASENRIPDLTITPAKTFLAGIAAADTVQPAVYVNGSRVKCGPGMYAYEIPDAPFLPDYNLGSHVQPLTQAQ